MNLKDGEVVQMKWRAGRYMKPVEIIKKGTRLFLKFGYSPELIAEVKSSFADRKWHGYDEKPLKMWSISDTEHNWFQISYLACQNPYAHYDKELIEYNGPVRNGKDPYPHQDVIAAHFITRRRCVEAGEMGVGKTLAAINAMEYFYDLYKITQWLWVGPKSSLPNVRMEFADWGSKIIPRFVSYNQLKEIVETWPPDTRFYMGVVFDECQKLKTATSQRSRAAAHICSSIRKDWGEKGCIFLMSGTPAPKNPLDWWHIAELAQPGFLKEGSIHDLKSRLSIVSTEMNPVTGGMYPKIKSWKDDPKKCGICGEYQNEHMTSDMDHAWVPSVNEIEKLGERLKGLVHVTRKKDCLNLPDKVYRVIECKPTLKILNAAKIIGKSSPSVIRALTLLRELSDGFQYAQKENGKALCEICSGKKSITQPTYKGPEKTTDFLDSLGLPWQHYDSPDDVVIPIDKFPQFFELEDVVCPNCRGDGYITTYERTTTQFDCPKDEVLKDLLEEFEDIGRLVIYAGFTGSVDKCVDLIQSQGWDYIRVDGRGWQSNVGSDQEALLRTFQDTDKGPSRLAFIGAPTAAGTSFTLTASPAIVYFSNDFNAEARIQSEDRIHRIGMDVNRGATIIDILHLPSDLYVLDNLKAKRRLQDMSLGSLKDALDVEYRPE